MYSSSPQRPMGPGLARYGSAPSHVQSVAEDEFSASAAVSPVNLLGKFFSADSSCITSESTCKHHLSRDRHDLNASATVIGLERSNSSSFCVGDMAPPTSTGFQTSGGLNLRPGTSSSSSLSRHSSSPAGFLSNLMLDNNNGGGFSVTRGLGNYSSPAGCNGANGSMANRILKSQLSLSRQDSQISDVIIPDVGESARRRNGVENGGGTGGHSYGNFKMGSWDETNSIAFSAPPGKRAKHMYSDFIDALDHIDSQHSLGQKSAEMASVERLLQLQQDSVACKIRAKRGCATHPRSIAERDRRTRISDKLRKLQELVPNMDKQTNTAEMLDLAVQHIKTLQNHVQELQRERENCSCGSRNAT